MSTRLNPEEIRKLDYVITSGVEMKERHKIEADSLREAVKAIAESAGLKPKSINKAIALAFKADYQDEVEHQDELTIILESTGRM